MCQSENDFPSMLQPFNTMHEIGNLPIAAHLLKQLLSETKTQKRSNAKIEHCIETKQKDCAQLHENMSENAWKWQFYWQASQKRARTGVTVRIVWNAYECMKYEYLFLLFQNVARLSQTKEIATSRYSHILFCIKNFACVLRLPILTTDLTSPRAAAGIEFNHTLASLHLPWHLVSTRPGLRIELNLHTA